jgi:glucokinase
MPAPPSRAPAPCSATADVLALVADIGGTNARFALAELDGPLPTLHQVKSLAAAGFASLQHVAEHYLTQVDQAPRAAALAVACPVRDDAVRLTNRAWSFSRRELREALGLERLLVLNDFGAAAWTVPILAEADSVPIYGPASLRREGPISVLGPGTGLGVALLVGDDRIGWRVVETEGGHVSFAPHGTEEREIADWLTARHGRVSNERVLSGSGLAQIDAALAQRKPGKLDTPDASLRDPADIVAAALEGHDVSSRRALARFCAILGSVAGDTALMHGARTVMIAGGIVPRFIPFLRASAFRERFLDKGRFAAYLESVSVRVITHPAPGLLGAALALRADSSAPPTPPQQDSP